MYPFFCDNPIINPIKRRGNTTKKPVACQHGQTTGKESNYLPKIQANISGATMVASDSMT